MLYLLNIFLMNTAIIFAQILGPFCILAWLSLVINKKMFKEWLEDLKEHFIFLFSFWIFTFMLGVYILISIPSFANPMEIIVKIFWMLMTIKWAMLMLFPKITKKMIKKSKFVLAYAPIFWIIYIIIGGYLTYLWYTA